MTRFERAKWWACGALAATWAAICGWPYYRWTADPSLFYDDFNRVGSLRRSTLGEALFRPFNEHMAPLFELTSWLAWQGGGRQILTIPWAFMVASYLAFGATVVLLAAVIRREVRSTTTTLVAITFFTLSSVSAETVLLYSASSFQWAASATLAAWLAASMAVEAPSRRVRAAWLAASAASALTAPAFCAIGMLAGPFATLRILASINRPVPFLRRLAWSIVPPAGTAAYLVLCEQFRYRELLSASVQHHFEPWSALWAMLRAPTAVLVPSLFGLPNLSRTIPDPILAGMTLIGLGGSLAWAWRSPRRPLILGGLALIVGGYLSTYATRASPENIWILGVQRYHLIPQVGLIFLLAALTAARLSRLDPNIGRALVATVGLAAVLAVPQYPRMKEVTDHWYRYPDQARALAATVRLEAICDREGITLEQSMRTLEPIQTRWFPRESPFNPCCTCSVRDRRPPGSPTHRSDRSWSPRCRRTIAKSSSAGWRRPATDSPRAPGPMPARPSRPGRSAIAT